MTYPIDILGRAPVLHPLPDAETAALGPKSVDWQGEHLIRATPTAKQQATARQETLAASEKGKADIRRMFDAGASVPEMSAALDMTDRQIRNIMYFAGMRLGDRA